MNAKVFWHWKNEEAFQHVHAHPEGLKAKEAKRRLRTHGRSSIKPKKETNVFLLLLTQFKSPLILLLIFAAILSYILYDRTNALIILTIVIVSGFLGFLQERGAVNAVAKLLKLVQINARVMRDGKAYDIPSDEVVPGDIFLCSAGDVVPGDCLLLEANDLFMDEATLTGETYPVEKEVGVLNENTILSKRTNTLFMGSHVISGSAKALVIHTGKQTEFGGVCEHLKYRLPETSFEQGVRHFGFLLLNITLMLVIAIFGINIFLHRPVIDSFMFALALAVGLTPQLLPAIITINLSQGAKRMAKQNVIIKSLPSIENFGSMTIFCADKTGTLTSGIIELHSTLDAEGKESQRLKLFALLNATYQTGYTNPIDEALTKALRIDLSSWRKCDEIPYDFVRKKLSILASDKTQNFLITKGAFAQVLASCNRIETSSGDIIDIEPKLASLHGTFESYGKQGLRALALAYRPMPDASKIKNTDERDLIFLGFLLFFDPPKPEIQETIRKLHERGVQLKVITGDNRLVAGYLAAKIGLSESKMISGDELRCISDDALHKVAIDTDLFVEVEPNQKERIILALRKAGHVVGFLGDGINDASAIHAADVGISVDSAADVVKDVADIILLKKDLSVLIRGVEEGRKTFANTLKYIFMATSANFGNMFSMAGASLFLNFLPLLPSQILLTNLLTDFPEMSIATDRVDEELVAKPLRWDIGFIRRFMLVFGLISSIFDFITFGVLLLILKGSKEQFRTGWFIESVFSACLVVLVVRTRHPFFKSRPSKPLTLLVLGVIASVLFLPYTRLGMYFELVPLSPFFLFIIAGIVAMYVVAVEIAKKFFYRQKVVL